MVVVAGGRTDKSKVLYTRSFCARLLMQALGLKGAREDTGTGIRTEIGKALGTGRGKMIRRGGTKSYAHHRR